MLVVGLVGWEGQLHFTRLTPDEQYTHISLWSLLAAPLLIGCDMARLDDFTVSLLSNDEVLAVSQDPLGQQALTVSQVPNPADPGSEVFEGRQKTELPKVLEVLARPLEDGSYAAGLFNRSTKPAKVTARWADLKIAGKWRARDLWRQKDLGTFEGELSADVKPHGVVLVQLFAEK
jgi:alpha-galactosidase